MRPAPRCDKHCTALCTGLYRDPRSHALARTHHPLCTVRSASDVWIWCTNVEHHTRSARRRTAGDAGVYTAVICFTPWYPLTNTQVCAVCVQQYAAACRPSVTAAPRPLTRVDRGCVPSAIAQLWTTRREQAGMCLNEPDARQWHCSYTLVLRVRVTTDRMHTHADAATWWLNQQNHSPVPYRRLLRVGML